MVRRTVMLSIGLYALVLIGAVIISLLWGVEHTIGPISIRGTVSIFNIIFLPLAFYGTLRLIDDQTRSRK